MTLSTLPVRRHAVRHSVRPRFRFVLARHDIRSTLPAALQPAAQNGLLVRNFQQALLPDFLFPNLCDVQPWGQRQGDTGTFTRMGLLQPATTPVTGTDPTPGAYSLEQWSMTMDQYANALDTNLLQDATLIQSKVMQDVRALGINGAQTLNRLARNALYVAYRGGTTYATASSTSSTSLVVADVSGFSQVLVNGVPTAVSGAFPKSITVNGVANTVIGANPGTLTLTLGTAISAAVGWVVVAADAPTIIRPNGKTSANGIVASDVATFAAFRSAVARLRSQNVPGPYVAHIDATTEVELFSDPDWKTLSTGALAAPQWGDLAIGTFGGITWVRNIETETTTNLSAVTVHRPIVVGGGALIAGPLQGQEALADSVPQVIHYREQVEVSPGLSVTLILRAPQDRLGQVLSSAWQWTGAFAAPSDSTDLSGDPARYKRACVVEHA